VTASGPTSIDARSEAGPAGFASVPGVSVEVRPSRPEELTAAGETVRRAYRADGLALDGYGDLLADTATRSQHAEIVVAVEDGVVLGCVTFVQPGTRYAELSRPGEAEFRMLGVDPAARGRGVGAALATWCLDRARALGAGRLVLSSDVRMTGAHRLYDRLGFVRAPGLDWSPHPGVELFAFVHGLG
jgi:ribosomal protein S18 acetylase RimI-like enzyme